MAGLDLMHCNGYINNDYIKRNRVGSFYSLLYSRHLSIKSGNDNAFLPLRHIRCRQV